MVSEVPQNSLGSYFGPYSEKVRSGMHIIKTNCLELASDLLPEAEKELAAFARAVEEEFGAEQVRPAIEDWIEVLESMNWQAGRRIPDWRCLTVVAVMRLANRAAPLRLERVRPVTKSESVAIS